jgi:hypothetical protein
MEKDGDGGVHLSSQRQQEVYNMRIIVQASLGRKGEPISKVKQIKKRLRACYRLPA